MTVDERLELAEKYNEVFGGVYPRKVIEDCKKLKILGAEWGEYSFGEYGCIATDFYLLKGGVITNQSTHYEFDKNEYYIHWDNGNIGRLMFLYSADWSIEETEIWEEFRAKLMSYNVLEYDGSNCHMIFSIEDGKKLIADYGKICEETKDKFKKYRKQKELKKKKEEYEKLKKELEGETE